MLTVRGIPDPGRCLVMGVLNVTPDSFSDGGRWSVPGAAIAHGLELHAAGADIVDVGGESTRPGAVRVDVDEELDRVVPVIGALTEAGAVVSVDTMRASVVACAVEAGARVVNDVSGGRADPDMLAVVADAQLPYVVMHWRGHSSTMQDNTVYADVVADVVAELRPQVDAALDAGVTPDRLVVDPGLGFAKTAVQNWALLHGLGAIAGLGHPVLVGASRKRFLGELLAERGDLRPTDGRDAATAATSALAAVSGAWCVRVHDVGPSLDAVRVAARWADG